MVESPEMVISPWMVESPDMVESPTLVESPTQSVPIRNCWSHHPERGEEKEGDREIERDRDI